MRKAKYQKSHWQNSYLSLFSFLDPKLSIILLINNFFRSDLKDLMLAVATRGEISSAFIFLNHMIEMGSNRRTPLRAEFALLRQVILSGQVG